MKNVKKLIGMLAIFVVAMMVFSGCSTHKEISYSYDVTTGDRVKITLNAKDGYSMTASVPIKFTKNNEEVAEAKFYQLSAYTSTVNAVKSLSSASVIEEKSNDEVDYMFYNYNNEYYSYIIKIKNSKTCLELTSKKSESDAKDCFNRLSFKLEK